MNNLSNEVVNIRCITIIGPIEEDYLVLDRYLKNILVGALSSELQEDMQFLQTVQSKIRFKLVVFWVSLGQLDKDKINFVIPELQNSTH